jgi:hypothetical protein
MLSPYAFLETLPCNPSPYPPAESGWEVPRLCMYRCYDAAQYETPKNVITLDIPKCDEMTQHSRCALMALILNEEYVHHCMVI